MCGNGGQCPFADRAREHAFQRGKGEEWGVRLLKRAAAEATEEGRVSVWGARQRKERGGGGK